MKLEALHPNFAPDTRVSVIWLLGCCCRQLRRFSVGASAVFILEHCFVLKSFAAVREAFSSAHFDKQVPNKTVLMSHVTLYSVLRFK
jgi:hypothetical protein